MSSDHNPGQLLCILLTLLAVLATSLVIACSLAHQYGFQEPIPGLLRQDLQSTASAKPIPISPAPWIHWTWAVVFLWQIALAMHAFISIFRKWSGVPVYTYPVLMSTPLLLCYGLACASNIGWFLIYDREYPSTACLFAALAAILAWPAFAISLYTLEVNLFRLRKGERYGEIYLHRFLVHNGLALYAQWCMFVAAFNVAMAMMHNDRLNMEKDLSTMAAMVGMGTFMIAYFLLDITCLDKHTRYTVTPYILSIIVLTACLSRQDDWMSDDVNFLFLTGLLAFAMVSLMIKSACVACRVMRPSTSGSADITSGSFRRVNPDDEDRYLLK